MEETRNETVLASHFHPPLPHEHYLTSGLQVFKTSVQIKHLLIINHKEIYYKVILIGI